MNILIIDDCVDLMGGVERTLCTLANELVKNNEVRVLSKNQFVRKSFFGWDNRVKKEYIFHQASDRSVLYRGIKRKCLQFFEKAYRVIFRKKLIKKAVKDNLSVDVIIFGRVFVALEFLPYLRKSSVRPRIIVRDAIHLDFFSKRSKKKIKRLFPGCVDDFIVSSEESVKKYEAFFGDGSVKLKKIYNPIGIVPREGCNFGSKTVVSIGRMDDDQKGFSCLIEAFDIVHKKHADWKLVIYGDGSMKSVFQKIINKLGASEYIILLPAAKDVVKVFNESAIFVLASRYEGYANILVEALACGIPSVTFDWLMGADEIVENGKNGTIVQLSNRYRYFEGENQLEDSVRLAEGICKLIDNPKLAAKYSSEAPSILASRDTKAIMEEWLSLTKKDSV